jgi:hypothetical protein
VITGRKQAIRVMDATAGWGPVLLPPDVRGRAVDCLQAAVSRCGGITEWLRVAAQASRN